MVQVLPAQIYFAFEEGGVKSAFVFGGFSFFFLLFSVDELMTIPKNERDLDNLHYLLLVEFTILNLCRYSSIVLLYVTFTTMGEARKGPEVGGPTSTNTSQYLSSSNASVSVISNSGSIRFRRELSMTSRLYGNSCCGYLYSIFM